jgi:hypothetical protein
MEHVQGLNDVILGGSQLIQNQIIGARTSYPGTAFNQIRSTWDCIGYTIPIV